MALERFMTDCGGTLFNSDMRASVTGWSCKDEGSGVKKDRGCGRATQVLSLGLGLETMTLFNKQQAYREY